MQFTGCGTALVTPFQLDFSLDEAALRKLVQRQLNAGVDFLVPCGTTGENPTLKRREHLRVVEITLEESAGEIPVLAGAGGYNTQEVAELARELEPLVANAVPNEFTILSGDDAITLPLFALGGRGVISVAANEIPAEMAQLCRHGLRGEFDQARTIHRKYLPLMEINFVESNPIPVKAALALMGLLEPVWRLPLVAPKAENLERIQGILDSLHLTERTVVATAASVAD